MTEKKSHAREGDLIVFLDNQLNREDTFFKSLIGKAFVVDVAMQEDGVRVNDKSFKLGWFSAWADRFTVIARRLEPSEKVLAEIDAAEKLRQALTTSCPRCGGGILNHKCIDKTCPFSDHDITCDLGWVGHPDHLHHALSCTCGAERHEATPGSTPPVLHMKLDQAGYAALRATEHAWQQAGLVVSPRLLQHPWQWGLCGNSNIVMYDGEDAGGIAQCQYPALATAIIRSANTRHLMPLLVRRVRDLERVLQNMLIGVGIYNEREVGGGKLATKIEGPVVAEAAAVLRNTTTVP